MELHGKYQVGQWLGGGGMADVYCAEVTGAEGFSRHVAIKRLHAAISADETFCAMFIREARLLSKLHHANIVSVLDFEWDEGGQLFLVMELVDGVNLAQLASSGEMPVPVAMHVVCEVLRALAYAHERMIVHRDITPHNVLISWHGEVKLSDFGLAKATMSSHASPAGIKGKVQYLSPDQVHGLELDGRTDLFSVGVMFYELVTGRSPFSGRRVSPNTMAESIARMLTGTIVPPRDLRPAVPAPVEEVIMRLLERERERRFASAREVLQVLPRSEAGPEAVAALLAERFPDRKQEGKAGAGSQEQPAAPGEQARHLQIHDRPRRDRPRSSGHSPRRQARAGGREREGRRWRRHVALLAAFAILAIVVTARLDRESEGGAAREHGGEGDQGDEGVAAPGMDAGTGVFMVVDGAAPGGIDAAVLHPPYRVPADLMPRPRRVRSRRASPGGRAPEQEGALPPALDRPVPASRGDADVGDPVPVLPDASSGGTRSSFDAGVDAEPWLELVPASEEEELMWHVPTEQGARR